MTFNDAAKKQYLRSSFYTVWLVHPGGKVRVNLGSTQRKTGAGLLKIIGTPYAQQTIGEHIPNTVTLTKKTASAILLSNGWRIEFGGTIRQEAE